MFLYSTCFTLVSQYAKTSTMPQKTKKQKQLAVKHKQIEHKIDPQDNLTIYTIKDLRKTIYITAFILALEFLIFYANLKGIVSLNKIF